MDCLLGDGLIRIIFCILSSISFFFAFFCERSRAERGTPSLNGLSAELNLEPCYFCRAKGPLERVAGYCQVKLGLNLAINGLSRQKLS